MSGGSQFPVMPALGSDAHHTHMHSHAQLKINTKELSLCKKPVTQFLKSHITICRKSEIILFVRIQAELKERSLERELKTEAILF